jgi:tripartite-type tricarboxylate transporter receptor subunit TctC
MVANILSSRVNIESGKLKALGVTSSARAPALPDVPTISEAGLKDFEVLNWFGMFAPAGTPQPIIDRLQAEAAKIMHSPETKKRLSGDGADPIASTPAEFAKFVKSEMAKWAAVAKNANVKLKE